MEPTNTLIPVRYEMEGDISISNESPSPTGGHNTRIGGGPSPHQSSDCCAQGAADVTTNSHPKREDDLARLARLVADVFKDSVEELRKDGEMRRSREISDFNQGIEQLKKTIEGLKPTETRPSPATNFWTTYKKVARELDDDLVSKYVGDLDTSLLFAGLFSAVTSAFIAQIIPELQPDPTDLTNALLLRILQQNTSFGGTDPLTPISNISARVVRAQSILFASLAVTLFVAFIAVLGKQWILHYAYFQAKSGTIVDRGVERQIRFAGFQRWGFYALMELLPVLLQLALLLFGFALVVYLWDLSIPVAEVVLVVTSFGLAFYIYITVVSTIYHDCPFQTPLSIMLPQVWPWTKELKVWLSRRATRFSAALKSFRFRIKDAVERSFLRDSVGRVFGSCTDGTNTTDHAGEDTDNNGQPMTLSNPELWRDDPIFTSPIPKDIGAYAGFWLLENSTDFSAASSVAAVFSEFQWPSHHRSTTALIRLRDTYVECFRAPEFKNNNRLKALQSAAAYYVLYHAQLIWTASGRLKLGVTKPPPDLPPDLFHHVHSEEWGDDNVFEHLLHLKDRSEPVTSARFLSYIAPYWFCGNSDSIRFRPSRLQTLYELIGELDEHGAWDPVTLTDCILCLGAAVDFPLHPEDLIRVDKSDYIVPTFKMVVEHIHVIILNRGHRLSHAKTALEILLTLAKKITLPLVTAAFINRLLKSAAAGNMGDDTFNLFLELSAQRKEEDTPTAAETQPQDDQGGETGPRSPGGTTAPVTTTPEQALFDKISKNVQAGSGHASGWEDEAVYGGLIAMRDIPQLGSYLPDSDFLHTLSEAMKKGRPFHIRKVAYDIILAAQEGWLKSTELRRDLMHLDFPGRLHSVVIEAGRSDHQRPFLEMMETLSEDRFWHPYLRGAMEIWFPFRREGPKQVLQILARIGELSFPKYDDSNPPPLDEFIETLVEDEWARVPARPVMKLAPDLLGPLAEVTERLKEIFFTDDGWKVILATLWRIIPRLERRRDYKAPEEVCRIVNELIEKLRG